MAGGRPLKLTPELQEALVRDLALGVSRVTAARCAGVSPSAMFNWLRLGRAGDARFVALVAAVQKAEADAVRCSVGVVQKAAVGGSVVSRITRTRADGTVEVVEKFAEPQWTAAAWFLERRYPQDWASNRHELAELREQLNQLAAILAGANRPGQDLPDPPAGGGR